ncbi:MAG: putative rane protein [Chthoniobacter sp.]|jgi:predicted outer membrane protein|nr:putative rane protein [Chthoniobacter sp.]
MKTSSAVLLVLFAAMTAGAAEPKGKAPSADRSKDRPKIEPPPAAPGGEVRTALITSDLGGREIELLKNLNDAGLRQLALASLAQTKAESEMIKSVGTTLAKTQVDENKQLARLATAKGLHLSSNPPQKLVDELVPLSGPRFEKTWIDHLIAVSEAVVGAYEAGTHSSDADVKSFAEQMLPIAHAKLQVANRLAGNPAPRAAEVSAPPTAATTPKPAATPAAAKPPWGAPAPAAPGTPAPKSAATPKSGTPEPVKPPSSPPSTPGTTPAPKPSPL